MPKELILFSDIELGGGTNTDDFACDGLLVEIINSFQKEKNPIDLILNGDTFDFLKCPIIRKRFTFYLEHITANVALEKLDLIYGAHKSVFIALKKFLKQKKNNIYFIYGNHDYELLFPEIQKKIKNILNSENVFFQQSYFKNRVYAEHGHMYDIWFRYNPKKVFRDYNGKKELNIPALFSGFSKYFMDSKECYPFLDRIDDKLNLLKIKPTFKIKLEFLIVRFFIYQIIFSIFNFIARGYILSYFKAVFISFADLFRGNFEISSKKLYKAMKKVPKGAKVVFFGHVHEKVSAFNERTKKRMFILDTWRDEYSFSDNLKYIVPKTKRYAKVIVEENGKLKITLYDYSAKGGKHLFEKIVADEYNYFKKIFDNRNKVSSKEYDIDKTTYTIT